MWIVESEGKTVAYTERSPYVKIEDGVSKICPVNQAEGIVAGGNTYNLLDHEEVFPGRPVAYAYPVDTGSVINQVSQRTDNNTEKIAEVDDTALASLEATTDLYEQLLDKGVLE
jgi:hypothetical protein